MVLAVAVGCGSESEGDRFVDDLLSRMTLEEKIGQLNLIVCPDFVSGQIDDNSSQIHQQLKDGALGGLFGFRGAENVHKIQQEAVESSRLGIPLIFGYDVIHGIDISFPIPLALSTSWDPKMIEEMARLSAKEASADGVCWTYSPMVDICHDARWGRIAEGSGEDPYLGSELAKAYVRGYQGSGDLSEDETIMACVKHYALYGAAEAGRDYNTVDMSRQRAFNEYLMPYKAAADEGAGSFMVSFNEFEGIPATANSYLIDEVLRKQWGFNGFVVTDYTGIMEMTRHGIGTEEDVTVRSLKAGVDMDMMSEYYLDYLKSALEKGRVSKAEIDQAVRRVLLAKYQLGLFADPYKYCKPERAAAVLGDKDNVEAARRMAQRSQVLLKNEGGLLPLKKTGRIAVIGPMANNAFDMVGCWSGHSDIVPSVGLYEGIKEVVGDAAEVTWAEGSHLVEDAELEHNITNQFVGALGAGHQMNVHQIPLRTMIDEAVGVARKADVVIAALGENLNMNGEGTSRANPTIPQPQKELLKALLATGKPVVLVTFTGRPLVLTEEDATVPAILNSWFLGVQAGPAIADVLFGDVNPSGKLTTSFPRSIGQIPMSYNHKNTGRPVDDEYGSFVRFRSDYMDVVNAPLYPFGFGLSYTTYEYGKVALSSDTMGKGDTLTATVKVTNTGCRKGLETVQLYIRDLLSESTRPVKELKGFKQVSLEPGESAKVQFALTVEDLKYYNHDLKFVAEPGEFSVMVGPNSRDVSEATFVYR